MKYLIMQTTHAKPSSHGSGSGGDCACHPQTPAFSLLCPAQGIQELPKSLHTRLHSLGSCTACQSLWWTGTPLLLTRQTTANWSLWVAREREVHTDAGMLPATSKSKLRPKMPGTLYCTPRELAFNSLCEMFRLLSDCASLSKLWPCFPQQLKVNSMASPCSTQDLLCQTSQPDKYSSQAPHSLLSKKVRGHTSSALQESPGGAVPEELSHTLLSRIPLVSAPSYAQCIAHHWSSRMETHSRTTKPGLVLLSQGFPSCKGSGAFGYHGCTLMDVLGSWSSC